MASKNIKLVTYAGSTVTPQDDALIHETAIPKSGIIYGGKTTKKTNNTLHIAAGHGIVCGRKFTISECDVPVQLTGGASHNGRVYIHMDLSNSTNPIQILIETGTQLSSEIQQKDVNILNGVYEFNLATFMVDATTIYNVVDVFPVVSGKDMSELEKTFVKKRDILKTMEEVSANKDADKVVGPEVVKELSNDLGNCKFGFTPDGKPGWKEKGADTVYPFKKAEDVAMFEFQMSNAQDIEITVTDNLGFKDVPNVIFVSAANSLTFDAIYNPYKTITTDAKTKVKLCAYATSQTIAYKAVSEIFPVITKDKVTIKSGYFRSGAGDKTVRMVVARFVS